VKGVPETLIRTVEREGKWGFGAGSKKIDGTVGGDHLEGDKPVGIQLKLHVEKTPKKALSQEQEHE